VVVACPADPLSNGDFEEGVQSWDVSVSGTGGYALADVDTSTDGHNLGSSLLLTLNINDGSTSQSDPGPPPLELVGNIALKRRDIGTGTDSMATIGQTVATCPGLAYDLTYCKHVH
jgi:hypothetical protein